LALAQSIAQAQSADRGGKVKVAAARPVHGRDLRHGRRRYDLRLLFVKRSVAPAAQIIAGTELNEQAVVATNNFPGVDRG
jgi:hypothetical protein